MTIYAIVSGLGAAILLLTSGYLFGARQGVLARDLLRRQVQLQAASLDQLQERSSSEATERETSLRNAIEGVLAPLVERERISLDLAQLASRPGRRRELVPLLDRIADVGRFETVLLTTARRARLDRAIAEMAANSEYTPVVRRLCCLRGVSTLTGFGLAVEIGDWQRFTGSTIGAYLGLVPTESSTGSKRVQGSITKAGNTHARRLLVEAAWHHRKAYRPGLTMQARWNLAPAAARARGHQGNQRLHDRWEVFTERKKRPVIANVAIARELAGWCWSLAVMDG